MKNRSYRVILTVVAFAVGMSGEMSGPAHSLYYDPNEKAVYDNYFDSYYDGYTDEFGYDTDEYVLTDLELRQAIVRNLFMSPFVDGKDIDVSVQNGIATLSGTLEDRSAMIDAVEIAYDAGARRVRNQLRQLDVDDRPWEGMRDDELKDAIENELTMSPFVDADRIRVTVRNGVATLSGRLENKGEIADAVENAYEAGAKRVKSRLWVE